MFQLLWKHCSKNFEVWVWSSWFQAEIKLAPRPLSSGDSFQQRSLDLSGTSPCFVHRGWDEIVDFLKMFPTNEWESRNKLGTEKDSLRKNFIQENGRSEGRREHLTPAQLQPQPALSRRHSEPQYEILPSWGGGVQELSFGIRYIIPERMVLDREFIWNSFVYAMSGTQVWVKSPPISAWTGTAIFTFLN